MHTESSHSGSRDRFVGAAGNDLVSVLVQQRRMREMSRALTVDAEARVMVRAGEDETGGSREEKNVFKDLCDRLKQLIRGGREPLDRGGCCAVVNGYILAGHVPGWCPSWAQ